VSHRALNQEQFQGQLFDPDNPPRTLAEGMGLHPSLGGSKVPEVIHGPVARHVMHQADIRQTKRGVDAPHIATGGYQEGESEYSHPRGTVMTSQRHLHVPTLQRYARGDVPEHDPERSYSTTEEHTDPTSGEMFVREVPQDVPYLPEHYHHGGTQWLAEGHHRTVVHRLAK
jgi:hypothetical protein